MDTKDKIKIMLIGAAIALVIVYLLSKIIFKKVICIGEMI